MKNNDASKSIKNLRSTEEGNLLIVTEKNEKALEKIQKLINEDEAPVTTRVAGPMKKMESIFLREMDATTTQEDIIKSIQKITRNLKETEFKISNARPNSNYTKAATLTIDKLIADAILQKKEIRLGMMWQRRKFWKKVREDAHKDGHRPGSGRCQTFKEALGRAKQLKENFGCAHNQFGEKEQEKHKGTDQKNKKLMEGRRDQEEPGSQGSLIISNYKILHINVGRSKAAHDLLDATAAKEGKTIILISEPNVNITKQNDNWKTDIKIDAVIKIRDNNIACVRQGRDNGCVYVEVEDMRFYSCYISPNCSIEEYDTFLSELQSSILSTKKSSYRRRL
ncbi:hypothetical protein HHI36_012479 [Cryptolaemus montrouzieri]|uniref:Uncharacterized protein n=1 Tax=Cryptolaemus montrouzieri TaxID=559131 RepID=A0ABD2NEE7_9CUCU